MPSELHQQIEAIFKKFGLEEYLYADTREGFVLIGHLVKLIEEREDQQKQELLGKVKAILQTEIDDAKELNDQAIRIIIMGWLLNAHAQIKELEQRHDG